MSHHVSLKDGALLIQLFYKNNDSSPVALEKFRSLKGMQKAVSPMTVQGLLKIIQKFEITGSFEVHVVEEEKELIRP